MEKSARCGFLHTRLSPSRCQPTALESAGPACPTRSLPAHCRKEAQRRANCPHLKLPGTHLGMPGIFLLRSDGRHAGRALPLSTAAKAKCGKLCPMRAFGGRRQSAHRPACFRRTAARGAAPGKPPPSKNPRHSHWNAGDFFRSDGRHAGGALPLSTAAAAKGGKLSLYGLLPGAGGLALSLHSLPAHRRKEAQRRADCPIGKSPALVLECRGFFCINYSCCAGGHFSS